MSIYATLSHKSSTITFGGLASYLRGRAGGLCLIPLLVLTISGCSFEVNMDSPRGKAKKNTKDYPVEIDGKGAVWDESSIYWEDYGAGMDRALRENKPVLLVIATDWCGYCKAYSWTFLHPEVVSLARDMVMIRVDADAQPGAAKLHERNGRGVPRTFLFPPGGYLAMARGKHPDATRIDYNFADPLIYAMRDEVESSAQQNGSKDAAAKNTASANPRVLCIVDGKPIPMDKKECKSETWVVIQ
jgi:thiol-disulfide isomerase/thioredoxin